MTEDKETYLAQLITERKSIFEKKLKEFNVTYKHEKEVEKMEELCPRISVKTKEDRFKVFDIGFYNERFNSVIWI